MRTNNFYKEKNFVVGVFEGINGSVYKVYFDIRSWKDVWKKENIKIDDLLGGTVECITSLRKSKKGKTIWQKVGN
jgi:rRNA processing protein Gar1